MKKRIFAFFLILSLCLPGVLSLTAQASQAEVETAQYNKNLYHFTDVSGSYDQAELREENKRLEADIEAYEMDFPVLFVKKENHSKSSFGSYLDHVFENNQLGYGAHGSGIMLGIETDGELMNIRLYGRANVIFDESAIARIADAVREGYDESLLAAEQAFRAEAIEIIEEMEGLWDEDEVVFERAFEVSDISLVSDELPELIPAGAEDPEAETEDDKAQIDETIAFSVDPEKEDPIVTLPDWYVTDPDSFVDFHNDPSESRIVDIADLLDDDQEKLLAEKIAKIRDELGRDVVVYTDTTSYGMDNELYCMDFYVYNGYGVGDDFEGLILFVNMDPENREMVSVAFGDKSRSQFTQWESNSLDDILYAFFVDRKYGEGILNWIEGVDSLFRYGSIYIPEWYKQVLDGTVPANASDEKIYMESGYMTDDERAELEGTIAELREKYGADIVFFVGSSVDLPDVPSYENENAVADLIYNSRGYGIGENKTGILLCYFTDLSSDHDVVLRTYGDLENRYKPKMLNRLKSIFRLNVGAGHYYKNMKRYLYYLRKSLKNGRVPHTWPVRITWLVICLMAGILNATIPLDNERKKLVNIRPQVNANYELIPGSFKLHSQQNILIGSSVKQTYSPQKTYTYSDSGSSSSRSSTPRSTYSSHSHSSSGRSGTSSRRKF